MGFDWSRPRAMGLDFSSNRLPWSAPWMTNKEATEVSSPRLGSIVAKTSDAGRLQARLINRATTVNPSAVEEGDGSWSSRRDPRTLGDASRPISVDRYAEGVPHRTPGS